MGEATTPTRKDPLLRIQERILRGVNEFVHLEVSGSISDNPGQAGSQLRCSRR
jgi:hypothetical protein